MFHAVFFPLAEMLSLKIIPQRHFPLIIPLIEVSSENEIQKYHQILHSQKGFGDNETVLGT